jgi:hypothetical protein
VRYCYLCVSVMIHNHTVDRIDRLASREYHALNLLTNPRLRCEFVVPGGTKAP